MASAARLTAYAGRKTARAQAIRTTLREIAGQPEPVEPNAQRLYDHILALEALDIELDPRWAVNEINGAVLFSPSGKCIRVDAGHGYVLERKIFEKFLAGDAIRAGARYMVKTLAMGVIKDDGKGLAIAGLIISPIALANFFIGSFLSFWGITY